MFMQHKLGLLLFITATFLLPSGHTRDTTIEEWSKGKEVTEAVLRIISRSGIFAEDDSFFIRLAYVESRFGENNNTFRTDYFGGIWQVEESVFRITQTNHSKLFPLHQEIQTRFRIDWPQITWKHLVRPLYSGLAAALYFARVADIEAIPQTIAGQAAHWKKYYRPLGEVSRFERDSEELRNQTRCRGKMDLCIVLDSSGSINQGNRNNYQIAKNFTASMIESFSPDFTRIGMQIYSDDPLVIFEINNNFTTEEQSNLARGARYLESGTRTDKAIKLAVQMFNRASAIIDLGVPKIMTVFTDGKSDFGSDMTGAMRAVQNSSIKPIAVGIGSSTNQAELRQIALGDLRSVFSLQDFAGLQDFLQLITSVTCDIPQAPVLNTTYADTLIENEKRVYKIEPPPEGITVNLEVSLGQTNGFWSHSEEVPTEAVHDGTLNAGATYIPAPPAQTRQGDEGDDDEDIIPSIYFTIQGVGETNNYTLAMVEGNQGGGSDSGAPITSLPKYVVFLLMVVYVVLK